MTPVTPGFLPNTVLGLAYRQPDTGQLLVTRPGRLLFPPPHAPRSRLAVAMPEGPPETPMAEPGRELTSRLLVPPPPTPPAPIEPAPIEPVVETPMAIAEPPVPVEPKAAAPAPEPAPPPASPLAPKAPEPQIAAQPQPSLPEPSEPEPSEPELTLPEPIEDTATPPPPSTLTDELTRKPTLAEPSQETAAVAPAIVAKTEPAPPPEPPPEPLPEPPPPLTAPAPADTETEPPPPPSETLTSGPAVEPKTAALPPVLALAEKIRVLFNEGSVVLGKVYLR